MPPGVTVMDQSFQVSFTVLFTELLGEKMTDLARQHYLGQVRIGLISNHVFNHVGCSHCEGYCGVRFRGRGG